MQSFVDETSGDKLIAVSEDRYPQLAVTYGGAHVNRPEDRIDVENFIGVKSHRAKGKRLSTFEIAHIAFVEPLEKESPEEAGSEPDEDMSDRRALRRQTPTTPNSDTTSPQMGFMAGDSVAFGTDDEESESKQMDLFGQDDKNE